MGPGNCKLFLGIQPSRPRTHNKFFFLRSDPVARGERAKFSERRPKLEIPFGDRTTAGRQREGQKANFHQHYTHSKKGGEHSSHMGTIGIKNLHLLLYSARLSCGFIILAASPAPAGEFSARRESSPHHFCVLSFTFFFFLGKGYFNLCGEALSLFHLRKGVFRTHSQRSFWGRKPPRSHFFTLCFPLLATPSIFVFLQAEAAKLPGPI